MQSRILTSPAWEEMKKVLVALPVRVYHIVCLALGNVFDRSGDNTLDPHTCSQHLSTCATVDFLEHYGGIVASSTIPIVVYESTYDANMVRLLARLPHLIEVVSCLHEYLGITPNTLVMCLYISHPVLTYKIVADLLFPSGLVALPYHEMLEQPWSPGAKRYVMVRACLVLLRCRSSTR
jgi:hypothetical protein